jgi:hypothetical protein
MFTVIRSTRSVNRAFNYNEAKVRRGLATRLAAGNYPCDMEMMSRRQKLVRLLDRARMNDRVGHSCVHISLNFHPGERLSDHKLTAIAAYFMEAIGMRGQPWLAYRHFDAGHPHLHIISVAIDATGDRIDLYRTGRRLAGKARTDTEVFFGLLRGRPLQTARGSGAARTGKIRYGAAATGESIARVLKKVLGEYRYGSFGELNALLASYHVTAGSRGGVYYHVLSEEGKKKGMPLRAASLPGKPVLAMLEKKFLENSLSGEGRRAVKNAVDLVLSEGPPSLEVFIQALQSRGVLTVSGGEEGTKPAQWIYVHHGQKTAVSARALGPAYNLEGVRERIGLARQKRSPSGADGKKEEGGCGARSGELPGELKLSLAAAPAGDLSEKMTSGPRNRIRRHL